MSTGPQKYPGAVTSGPSWYQDNYGGDKQEVNVIVLHTTEGTNLDGYQGGAVAPNFTAVPDFANKKLKWYQHFDFDTSSRALVNLSGGVQTNTNNVSQVELVGTCDPTTHKKWGSTKHIYWPDAPEWALDELAKFLAWANKNHNVPLVGPTKWVAYPSSYANGAGQRMSGTAWNAFKGICGHQHVPENVHGDPGALDFKTLIAKAKALVSDKPAPAPSKPAPSTSDNYTVKIGDTLYGIATKYKVTVDNLKTWNSLKSEILDIGQVLKVTKPKEEVVKVAKKDATYKSVWDLDAATPPAGHKTDANPTWAPMSILRGIYEQLEALSKKVDALEKKLNA